MGRYFCHEHPDVLSLETRVVDARPGAVVLEQTPFYPGGGGQLADRGTLRWNGGEVLITGVEPATDGRFWHLLGGPGEPTGPVLAAVDPEFRSTMAQLHTGTHILNALVFQQFDRALVTGAQLNDDRTARMDFDLPEADNDKLRALEAGLNDLVRQDLPLRHTYVPLAEATAQHGLIRSRSVAPPPGDDGLIRIVEIVGLDRQACGGTHLASTGRSGALRILKIDNKGRHNRRIRIGLER
jgi:misacylated tRNA(Ala) deacylase